MLQAEDRRLGGNGVVLNLDGAEVEQVGEASFVGFQRSVMAVVMCAEDRHATVRVVRAIGRKLHTESPLYAIVHHRNVESIIGCRKLGCELLGVDEDGYFHYELTREGFKYGKAKRTGSAQPAAC